MELWYVTHKGVDTLVHLMDIQHHQSKLASAYAMTSRHVNLLLSDLQDNVFGNVGPPLVSDVRAVMASVPDHHEPLNFSSPPIDVGIKLHTLHKEGFPCDRRNTGYLIDERRRGGSNNHSKIICV